MNRIPFALIILGLSETYTGIAIHQVLGASVYREGVEDSGSCIRS
jgi:hypothetical protein